MLDLEHEKKKRIEIETLERNFSAAIMFTAVGILMSVYRLDVGQFDISVQILCVLNTMINLSRTILSHLLLKKKLAYEIWGQKLKNILVLHCLNWGLLVLIVFYNIRMESLNPMILTLMTVGISSGTPISLLTLPRIQKLFLICSMLVPSLTVLTRYFVENGPAEELRISLILLFGFGYFLMISKQLRKMFDRSISDQFALAEEKEHLKTILAKLQETKTALVVEQNKSANSERLAFLGAMASGIAHEINNPLTISSGHVYKIRRALNELTEAKTKPEIDTSLKKLDEMFLRMTKVIRGLQSFSNESDTSVFDSCDLSNLIDFSVGIAADKMKNLGIEFKKENAPKVQIHCQKNQLAQVFVHLFSNAIDALKESQVKLIQLKYEIIESRVRISIVDSGPGIPENIQHKIFDPFFTTKEVGEGTGLGLSVSRGIAQAHKGEISVQSTQGQTTFTVELPILNATPAVTAA